MLDVMTYVDSMGVEGRWLAGVRDAGHAAAATLTHKRLLDVHQAVIGAGLESSAALF